MRQLLQDHRIQRIAVPAYYNFGRRLDRLRRQHDDATLRELVRIELDRYIALGLDSAALEATICMVLGTGEPGEMAGLT